MAESKTPNKIIKRVVVVLNTSPGDPPAIEIASILASKLQVELAGIFVEDINLLNLAELPFTREILKSRQERRSFGLLQLQRSLGAEVEKLRQMLMEQAEKKNISWSFSLVRGHIIAETVTATKENDLLIISRGCRNPIVGDHPSETVSKIASQSHCSVLVSGQQSVSQQPIYVVLKDMERVDQALANAQAIAEETSFPINILIQSEDEIEIKKITSACRYFFAGHHGEISIRVIDNIESMINEMKYAYYVVLADSLATDNRKNLENIIHHLKSPILIVR